MLVVPALGAFVAVNILYSLFHRLIATLRQHAPGSKYEFQTPKRIPAFDRLFGLDIIIRFFIEMQKHEFLPKTLRRFQLYGNTHSVNLRGCETIFTCEPENIKAVLATQFDSFVYGSRRKAALQQLLGPGIFSADGHAWKYSRELLRPAFHKGNFAGMTFLEKHVQNLLAAVDDHQCRRGQVDLQRVFECYTLDAVTDFFLGDSSFTLYDIDNSDRGQAFGAAFDRAQARTTSDFVLGPLAYLLPRGQDKADKEVINSFVDHHVQRVMDTANLPKIKSIVVDVDQKSEKAEFVLLEELAKQTSDAKLMRHEILNLLAAGRGTTSSLLSSMWFEFARRPDIYARLREEVATLDGTTMDFSALKGMKYLQSCLFEALRLFPPIPINTRTATRDVLLPRGGGPSGETCIKVSAGTSVAYSVYALHRRTDIWGADAEEFRPERWEGKKMNWEYLPFNGGPRLCLGQQLALTLAGYATTRLVQKFSNIEPCVPETTWKATVGFAVTVAGGVKVRLAS